MLRFFISILLLLFSSVVQAVSGQEASLCQTPAKITPLICEEGGLFLCVNTPPGSVHDDSLLLQGKLNLENGLLGNFSVMTQHEYTKEIQTISLENNFHLEGNGIFTLKVPLKELGPHTIFISATRSNGAPMQTTVRTSRVIAPTVTPDVVSYDPQIISGSVPEGTSHVRITLDLLAGCGDSREICDFIGASTSGLEVTVENKMASAKKSVACETNSIQGGAGRFVIGVPVLAGQNQLSITICNAVTGFDKSRCPKILPPPFTVGGASSRIEVISKFPLRFRIPGYQPAVCDNSVQVAFNFQKLAVVCSNAGGIFEVPLLPEEGYNIAIIQAEISGIKLSESIAFPHGRLLTGKILEDAVSLNFSASLVNETLLPKVNEFFESDDFLERLVQAARPGKKMLEAVDPLLEEKSAFKKILAYCPIQTGKNGDGEKLRFRLAGTPRIEKIKIDPIVFENQKLGASIHAENISIQAQVFRDDNGDSEPDQEALPIKIAFKTLAIAPRFALANRGGTTIWEFSAPHTDCSYKPKGACFNMPAFLTPKMYKGAASKAGAFVTCDKTQIISDKMRKFCHSLNTVDRQTGGVFQEKILDTINRMIACDGNAALNAYFQHGFPIDIKKELFELKGGVGVSSLKITREGVEISLGTHFGNPEDNSQPFIFLAPLSAQHFVSASENIRMGLYLPLISQAMSGLQKDGDDFSIVVDDAFFRQNNFDFDEKCRIKEGEKKEPLCNIRPRAQEIFGSPITTYGYLRSGDPVRLMLKPSKIFPLRVQILDGKNSLMRIELADWEITAGSLTEKFITGKLSVKLTAKLNGDQENGFRLRLIQEQSSVWFVPVESTNRTVIPGTILLAELREKIQSAVNLYAQEGQEIKIKIPEINFLPVSLGAHVSWMLSETQNRLWFDLESESLLKP